MRRDPAAPLYPPLEGVREVSRQVALAVGAAAQRDGVAVAMPLDKLERCVAATMWQPWYVRL